MFDRDHAQGAIRSIEEVLIGKLGVKTLDPLDWGYSPYYTLEDSDHYNTACGFNYHQGPVLFSFLSFIIISFIYFSFLFLNNEDNNNNNNNN